MALVICVFVAVIVGLPAVIVGVLVDVCLVDVLVVLGRVAVRCVRVVVSGTGAVGVAPTVIVAEPEPC